MNESRDSTQKILDLTLRDPAETRLRDIESHIDRLYERYHDLWDVCERLSGAVAQDVPLPLKYK